MMPASAAIVIDAFAPRERGRAMAVYAGCSQLFLALGPLVGGILTEAVSWRAVFWLNAPVGLASLALVRLAKPRNEPQPGTRMSVTSLGLLIGGLTATVLAIQQANTWSWTAPVTWLTLAIGLAVTTTFVIRQLHASQPLVNVRLLAKGPFAGNVIVLTFVQFALVALVLFNSLYAQDILGFHPLAAGVAALPLIVALAFTAQVGGRWYDRSGVRPPVLSGLTLTVVGVGTWAAALPSLNYPHQVPGMILTGIGIGLIMSPTNTDALSRIAPADRGQASGLLQTARQLGGTLGVAVIGAVVLAILHDGTTSPSQQHGADAVTVGFSCAAIALIGALAAGWLLLPRERLAGTGADEKTDVPVTTSLSR